jgi:uncharacterized protein YmfQ (DUF2313 family)
VALRIPSANRVSAMEDALHAFLPPGRLFSRPLGPNLEATLGGVAALLAAVLGKLEGLLDEANPRSASELLIDWETAFGLPDPCQGELPNLPLRRAAVVDRMGWARGSTIADFVAVAALYGVEVTIEERLYLRAGFRAGDRCGTSEEGWPWAIVIHLPSVAAQFAIADEAVVGDPVASWDDGAIRCVLERLKQAHQRVCFIADGRQVPIDYQPWGVRNYPDTLERLPILYKPTVT